MTEQIGNPQNVIPSSPFYIAKGSLRKDVNALIDELSSISRKCARGSKSAEADYHRTAAKLLTVRPALSEEDAQRQIKNSARLYHLAALIEAGRVPLDMKLKHPNV